MKFLDSVRATLSFIFKYKNTLGAPPAESGGTPRMPVNMNVMRNSCGRTIHADSLVGMIAHLVTLR